MASTWVSAVAVLLAFGNAVRIDDDPLPCGEVQASSSVVVLGSCVTATCVIREDCPLAKGRSVDIEWHLGRRLLPSSPVANVSSRTSTVVIPSFNDTRAHLTCCIQASSCQVIGGIEIRAGYPPTVPQNLTCQTNLTSPNIMICSWDPGQESTHLPTKYTLHTAIRDSEETHTYELPAGIHRYTIPRSDFVFFSDMEIFVKAVNTLGEATSTPIVLEPLRSAKFDPPVLRVHAEPHRYGCLGLSWALAPDQAWLSDASLSFEVRLKPEESSRWSEPIPVSRVSSRRPVEVCRLLHGTEYHTQIRVRYQQSPWSEWSGECRGATLEKAPTGRLEVWMKATGEQRGRHLGKQLFWKPSKQFRANGKNVSYIVSLQRLPGEKGQVCSTSGRCCSFQLLRGVRKVFLRAANAAGESNATEVPVLQRKARGAISYITVLPRDDDGSLLIQWKSRAYSAITGYVVEWAPWLNNDPSLVLFELANRTQSSLLITGSFEPYKPYRISVYPRFKDGAGLPNEVLAYTRQKAPSVVPEIKVKDTRQSYVELTWDEIPIGQRNGIIQNYKVFYWNKDDHIKVVNADTEKRRVVLTELNTVSLYSALLMVSTDGGSLNGSLITFKVEPLDAVAVMMIVIASCVGFSLLIIITVLTCFSNHKWLKGHFWPIVPDPANSSIKRWTSETIQNFNPNQDIPEPSPVYLSHLSLLDLPKKIDHVDIGSWLHSEDTSDLGESICDSPVSPGYSGTNSESVPYATVIFSGPYMSQSSNQRHVYLRSESTQPLLEAEETFMPKSYQNMPVERNAKDQYFFGQCQGGEKTDLGDLWDDFPLLQALAMSNTQNEI
ncbi:granulocyte colony-stimulating factor receptor [Lampris incognitus]|uniref:granulocyte colony-stimulating factor receptor n=1 Tax=Lampris incognitus TaxID=2546036 RepID=UPI0024B4F7CE|nr:granulocyte colony-stimulating factor receptor [Lampris incognitus]